MRSSVTVLAEPQTAKIRLVILMCLLGSNGSYCVCTNGMYDHFGVLFVCLTWNMGLCISEYYLDTRSDFFLHVFASSSCGVRYMFVLLSVRLTVFNHAYGSHPPIGWCVCMIWWLHA